MNHGEHGVFSTGLTRFTGLIFYLVHLVNPVQALSVSFVFSVVHPFPTQLLYTKKNEGGKCNPLVFRRSAKRGRTPVGLNRPMTLPFSSTPCRSN